MREEGAYDDNQCDHNGERHDDDELQRAQRDAIAAVVVGGTALTGGRFTLAGSVMGERPPLGGA